MACWIKVWRIPAGEQVLFSKPASNTTSAWRVALVNRAGVDHVIFGGTGRGSAAQQAGFPLLFAPLPARNEWVHIGATYDGLTYPPVH